MTNSRRVFTLPLPELLPLSLFFLLVVVERMAAVFYLLAGVPIPHSTEVLWVLASWLTLWAWWYAYSARRRVPLILDMGWFLAGTWPVLVPYYVLRTEGRRALVPIVLYAGLWIGSTSAYGAVYVFLATSQ